MGNICPEGSVIKATSIDPEVVGADGVFRHTGPAKVFTSEHAAISAIKKQTDRTIESGDVIVLAGCGPLGTGMEETYQLTSGAQILEVRQARHLANRCAFFRCEHWCLRGTHGARSAGRRAYW